MPCLRCAHCIGHRCSDLPASHGALPFYWYTVEGSVYSVALVRPWYEYGLPADATLPEVFLHVWGELVGVYDHAAFRSYWYGPFGVILGGDPPLDSPTPSVDDASESAGSLPLSPVEQQIDGYDSDGSDSDGSDGPMRRRSRRRGASAPVGNEFRLGPRPPSLVRRSESPRPPGSVNPQIRRRVRERGG